MYGFIEKTSDLKEENEKLQAEMDEYTGTNNGKSRNQTANR